MVLSLVYGDNHECELSCPEGEKIVSFVDGDKAKCLCVPEGDQTTEPPAGCTENCEE